MTFDQAQNTSDLLHLGTRLRHYLEPGSRLRIDDHAGMGVVTGLLNLSHDEITTSVSARCSFQFASDWPTHVPVVSTSEPWLIRDTEWHAYSDGSLCYIYHKEWEDDVPPLVSTHDIGVAAEFAAYWCIRSVRWLLYRHHFAFEHGIKKWPAQWPFWPHGEKADREYQKLNRDSEKQSNRRHYEHAR
jgi:hypothetical protein